MLRPFDQSGAFTCAPEGSGLRKAAVRGAGVTVFAQTLGFGVQMVATVVLARLLVPADFGVVAMVTMFSILLSSVGQIGFPEAVMQREQITDALASNLFWINLGVAVVLTLCLAASGPLLAWFYKDPTVSIVAIGTSFSIFLTSTSVLHLALLKRAMRFSEVSANDVVARMVSVAVSILAALHGWGYWALIVGLLAQPLSTAVGAWILCRWIPSFPKRVNGTAELTRFAVHVNGRWNFDYFARNMDNLLVGWCFGAASLGFYKKAYDLFALPSNQLLSVYPVAVSTLSRLIHEPAKYKRYFLGGVSVLAFIGMAIGADLTLVGKDLVRVVLGPHWAPSGVMFMFFGPGIGLMLIYGTHGIIHLSIGTTGRYFRWGIIEFVVTGLLFLIALPWGPIGIAAAWTVSFWILTIPAFWYAGKPINFGPVSVIGVIWRYLLASAAAGVVSKGLIATLPFLSMTGSFASAMAHIVITSLLFCSIYILAVVLIHGGWAPLRQLHNVLEEMLPWKKLPAPPTTIPIPASAEELTRV